MLEGGSLTLLLPGVLLCSPARKPEYCPRQNSQRLAEGTKVVDP